MSRKQEALAAKAAGFTRFKSVTACKKCGGFIYNTNEKCIECHRVSSRLYASLNKDKYAANSKAYKATDEGRKVNRLARLKYAKANPGKVTADAMSRHAAKLQRTPAWADLAAIKEFYAACPAVYEVDHVIPLQGKLVSGLHILSNLQYLPISDNRSKGNKFFI